MSWQTSNYSKINPLAEKHFPFKSPRKYQLETLSEIIEAIQKGYKYIVLEAGTGTGKSAIAAGLASIYDSSFILTVTKQLQDQYLRDFRFISPVKGRGNFSCRMDKSRTCEFGKCIIEGYDCRYSPKDKSQITEENTCSYHYQKYLALNSKSVISNYHYMFLELNYVGDFKTRSLMICDEAHNIESVLMGQMTLELERVLLKKYAKFNLSGNVIKNLENGDYNDWIEFINTIKGRFEGELEKIRNIEKAELLEKKIYLKNMIEKTGRFVKYIEFDRKMWIFDYDRTLKTVRFRPLKINTYAKDALLRHADVCVFMSATILDYRLFSKWLGISPDEIYAIRRKSPFDIKNNPIITFNGFNMSYANIKRTAPKTIPLIEEILEKHKNEKGIIHTVSGKCRDFLKDRIGSDRLIVHDNQNRSDVIDEFKKSLKPLVLISPSLSEGVDFPGDECRFQIMYKIPYPDLGDRQIALRSRIDGKWYDYKTSLALLQTHGRGMRFDGDFCRTYVIDSRFKNYVTGDMMTNNFISNSFRKAIDGFDGDKLYDYHLKSIASYRQSQLFECEVNAIIRLLKSDLCLSREILDELKFRLQKLGEMGYFDYENEIMYLEDNLNVK